MIFGLPIRTDFPPLRWPRISIFSIQKIHRATYFRTKETGPKKKFLTRVVLHKWEMVKFRIWLTESRGSFSTDPQGPLMCPNWAGTTIIYHRVKCLLRSNGNFKPNYKLT